MRAGRTPTRAPPRAVPCQRQHTLRPLHALPPAHRADADTLLARLASLPGGGATAAAAFQRDEVALESALAGVGDLLGSDTPVAAALAEGVRERCGADWGLATTGVAGPEPQDGKPVGLVYVAVAGPGGTEVRRLDLSGGRVVIRVTSVTEALRLLADRLQVNVLPAATA